MITVMHHPLQAWLADAADASQCRKCAALQHMDVTVRLFMPSLFVLRRAAQKESVERNLGYSKDSLAVGLL